MKLLAILLLALFVAAERPSAQRRGGPPQPAQEQGTSAVQGRGQGAGRGADGWLQGRGRGGLGQPAGTALIQGFVIAADTGTPIRRAEVRATSDVTRAARVVATDDNGRFTLSGLPAGRWTVTASKGGFVAQQFGQRRPFEVVPPIDLATTERRTINFTLWQGGVITGYVFDEFGDPITGARLQALRAQTVNGQRRLAPVGMTDQSDDRGSFRLYGLAPGDYYVTATVRGPSSLAGADAALTVLRDTVAAAGGAPAVDTIRSTLSAVAAPTLYAPTYYPGTPHAGQAQRIPLSLPGEEASASFTLLPVRAVQVTGTVAASSGAPSSATLTLTPADGGDIVGPGGGSSGVARADGSFVISGVVPGAYVLNVITRGRGSAGGEVAALPISVGAEGLHGVVVTTGPGAVVAGRVVGPGGTPPQTSGMQVIARAVRGGRNVQGAVSADGTFRLAGLIGAYTLDVSRVPQGWMVESIAIGGADATETPMTFRATEQVAGVHVVLTNRLTEVTGTVTSRGQPAGEYNVVVFSEDAARWANPARFLRAARGDAQGGFTIRGLPAGRYLAVAVDYLQQGEFQAREFLEGMRPQATAFTLGDGAQAILNLRLVER